MDHRSCFPLGAASGHSRLLLLVLAFALLGGSPGAAWSQNRIKDLATMQAAYADTRRKLIHK